jgi:dihydrofolate reductase
MMSNAMNEFMRKSFDLLLGRRTYEIFAAHWPYIKNDPIADKFNSIRKYVVSHKPVKLEWKNSILINGDAVAELRKLKEQDGDELWVHGSGSLIQTLLAGDLVDTLYVWTFPVLIGKGKRLFAEGTKPGALKLLDSRTSTTGVIISKYEPAGELKIGSFALDTPTEKEIARRKQLAAEI